MGIQRSSIDSSIGLCHVFHILLMFQKCGTLKIHYRYNTLAWFFSSKHLDVPLFYVCSEQILTCNSNSLLSVVSSADLLHDLLIPVLDEIGIVLIQNLQSEQDP